MADAKRGSPSNVASASAGGRRCCAAPNTISVSETGFDSACARQQPTQTQQHPPLRKRAALRARMRALHVAALPQIRRSARSIDPIPRRHRMPIPSALDSSRHTFVAVAVRVTKRLDLEPQALAQLHARTRDLVEQL